ncbi:Na+-driven multidrug efflux pump [Variovorax boronicumulans]|uniref:hypothetical protein n=1 Tax=Variovorax boronicumulans TaxID=436515 RepID=UPI00278A2D34|nr:hypothetical protein [Variovorax boronicumulans]MDP9912386.1 Na+-driven multidrug efflux pump [Variovorax boronicumulans]
MKTALRSTAIFTSVMTFIVVAADLLAALVYKIPPVEDLLVHGLFFIAVFFLCGAGAFIAFAALRPRAPTRSAVAVSALLFGGTSFFVPVWLFGLGGLVASAAWLVFGAAVFACVSALVARSHFD